MSIHQNKLLKEIEDLKLKLKRAEDALDEQMEKNEDLGQDNSILCDLLQERMPVGCIAETTYQVILDENEKLKEEIDKEDHIKDVMNDIINQVEEKEWKRVKSHNERLIRFHHRDTKKLKNMKEDWDVATEKIGQENSELHNEIKGLRAKLR